MNRNLSFIAIALFLWGIGEGMFFNFVPIYLHIQFMLNEYEIGLILGAFGFFMAITHVPAGQIADRFGRKPLLLIAWALGLISTFTMGISLALPVFLIGLAGYGLTAFVSSPLSSYATAARGQWPISKALSLTSATFNLGMALGPVTGGWIGDHYGMRMSFLAAAGIFVFSCLSIFFIESQPIDHHDPSSPPPHLRSNRRFMTLMGVLAFAIFSMYLAQPLTPNFLSDIRGLSLSKTGLVFAMGALGNSFMAFTFSRIDPRRGFLFSQMFVILFAIFIWKGTTLPVFALGYFLLGGFRASRPMAQAQARELVHESQMGVTYGLMETVIAVVSVLTPPIAGLLFEIDPFIVYPISIGLIAISIVISYFYSPQKAEEQVIVTS